MQQERDYQNIVSLCWKAGATHDSFITSLTKLLPCPASRELSSSWAAVTLALAAAELRHPALGAPHNTRTRKLFLPGRGAEATPANEISRITNLQRRCLFSTFTLQKAPAGAFTQFIVTLYSEV